MFFWFISLTLCESLWTARVHGSQNTQYYSLNRDEFEKVLLSTQESGDEFRIQLMDYDGGLSYYLLKPVKLYAKETLEKYPNQIYAFKGHKENDKSEVIGLIWCFRILKQFWMIRPSTVELFLNFDSYILYNRQQSQFRTLKEVEDINATVQRIMHENSDDVDDNELNEPRKLHLVPLTKRMDHIKIIRFVPFPTYECFNVIRSNKFVMTTLTPEEQKKPFFVQLAGSILFANMILLPQCSVRLEMLFCTDLITNDYYKKTNYLNSLNEDIAAGGLHYEKMRDFILKYFKDDRVDLAHIIHGQANHGVSVFGGAARGNKDKWQGISADNSFATFGAFELTFVHEVGHQLGARHTFSFQTNGGPAATEVGSGVSIMAYPGRSKGNDVQGQSSPYYTVQTLNEISRSLVFAYHLNTEPKEDQPPVIDDMKRFYYVPKSTAFLLQGSATDPDDSVLYYHWEQIDEFAEVVTRATFRSTLPKGPMMRDYDITTDNFRFIPKLERILQGKLLEESNPTDWETVPSVARTLNFAFVVRDKQHYSCEPGYVTFDTVKLQVTEDGPFQITSLNSPQSFARNSKTTIQWNVAGTNTGSINAQKVTIKFSPDRGQTWQVLHSNVDNTGSCEITFPNVATQQGRIMIKPDDNVFLTINTADITLT